MPAHIIILWHQHSSCKNHKQSFFCAVFFDVRCEWLYSVVSWTRSHQLFFMLFIPCLLWWLYQERISRNGTVRNNILYIIESFNPISIISTYHHDWCPNRYLNMNLQNTNTVNKSNTKSASTFVNPPLAGALNTFIPSNHPQSALLPNPNNTIKIAVSLKLKWPRWQCIVKCWN